MNKEKLEFPKFGFQIELVNAPKVEHPQMSSMDICKFINNFGGGFGMKIQPREFTKEEKVEFLKKQKKLLEEKVLKIGEQLKDFENPLKKTKKKGAKK